MPRSFRERLIRRDHDRRRDAEQPGRAFYRTAQWRALRATQLSREPLCERCSVAGVITPATVAHHKQAHKGDRILFFDAANLASSCKPCHDRHEQRIERGGKAPQVVDVDGWPIG